MIDLKQTKLIKLLLEKTRTPYTRNVIILNTSVVKLIQNNATLTIFYCLYILLKECTLFRCKVDYILLFVMSACRHEPRLGFYAVKYSKFGGCPAHTDSLFNKRCTFFFSCNWKCDIQFFPFLQQLYSLTCMWRFFYLLVEYLKKCHWPVLWPGHNI